MSSAFVALLLFVLSVDFNFLPLLVWRSILWTLTFRQAVDFTYLHWVSFRQVDFAYLLTLWVSICRCIDLTDMFTFDNWNSALTVLHMTLSTLTGNLETTTVICQCVTYNDSASHGLGLEVVLKIQTDFGWSLKEAINNPNHSRWSH